MDQIKELEKFPAILNYLFWNVDLDGRLQDCTKNMSITYLFNFDDYPPAAILRINKGKFTIIPLESEQIEGYKKENNLKIDASITGKLESLITVTWSLSKCILSFLKGDVKVKKPLKFLKILKILNYKGPFTTGRDFDEKELFNF